MSLTIRHEFFRNRKHRGLKRKDWVSSLCLMIPLQLTLQQAIRHKSFVEIGKRLSSFSDKRYETDRHCRAPKTLLRLGPVFICLLHEQYVCESLGKGTNVLDLIIKDNQSTAKPLNNSFRGPHAP